MGLFNLLETGIPVFGKTFDVSLNWIGELIRWLCTSVGVVGVGIILFSLVLKFITLPFDIYQRISMRKQNIQMKDNKEKMEKLQKQYANDKKMYNQKLMEMQKENGISVCSSCLPLILSMVIFIVAINAFNAYAQYANIENYNTMVDAYNGKMLEHCVGDITVDEVPTTVTVLVTDDKDAENNDLGTKTVTYVVKDEESYIYYKAYRYLGGGVEYTAETNEVVAAYVNGYANKDYFVDVDKAEAAIGADKIEAFKTAHNIAEKEIAVRNYLINEAQDAVVKAYNETVSPNMSFLWIKNIWATDASYKSPVLSAEDFVTAAKSEEFEVGGNDVAYSGIHGYTNAYKTETYNQVTAKLTDAKSASNGYYILIALSIGTILLQQFMMQRSQKEQQKYSSVDGSSGGTQKMTMIIMTGMFAIFSFMYSSAFSIYMITSNLFSMFSTFVINKAVDRKVEKKATAASVKRYENHAADRIEKAKKAGKQSAEESRKKND